MLSSINYSIINSAINCSTKVNFKLFYKKDTDNSWTSEEFSLAFDNDKNESLKRFLKNVNVKFVS